MTNKSVRNIPASIRQRLLNLARERQNDYGLVLTQYAIERLLARLCLSPYAEQFVLKGAQLFPLWMDVPHRPTRDLDLLRQDESDVPRLIAIFREVSAMVIEPLDGIAFLPDSVKGDVIREDAVYEGVRITVQYTLSSATDVVQVDIGVGDAVIPKPDLVEMPSILGFPPVRLRAYRKETVIAEKLEAMVALGIRNSRMKDFYDIWVLTRFFQFDGLSLCQSVAATFERRRTEIPDFSPLALTAEFWQEPTKGAQWRAFLRRLRLEESSHSLERIITDLQGFLLPLLHSLAASQDYTKIWSPLDGWQVADDTVPVAGEADIQDSAM
ncbi:MAG: nucleotidyl transferase AbiEii/AbiGii toxin family protein [bacterium]